MKWYKATCLTCKKNIPEYSTFESWQAENPTRALKEAKSWKDAGGCEIDPWTLEEIQEPIIVDEPEAHVRYSVDKEGKIGISNQ
jgi:hypothetical protein